MSIVCLLRLLLGTNKGRGIHTAITDRNVGTSV